MRQIATNHQHFNQRENKGTDQLGFFFSDAERKAKLKAKIVLI